MVTDKFHVLILVSNISHQARFIQKAISAGCIIIMKKKEIFFIFIYTSKFLFSYMVHLNFQI